MSKFSNIAKQITILSVTSKTLRSEISEEKFNLVDICVCNARECLSMDLLDEAQKHLDRAKEIIKGA